MHNMYRGAYMGYRIEYGQTVQREAINETGSFNIKKKTVYIALIILAAALLLFCAKTNTVRNLLLPGDPAVTEQALNTFAEQLRAGESIGDAATAFCQEIVTGANISR